MTDPAGLTFEADGARLFTSVLSSQDVLDLQQRLEGELDGRPGRRLLVDAHIDALLSANGKIGAVARTVLGREAWPVRVVLFDKTAEANWLVAWHQDRTVAVKARRDVAGYGPWSVKGGIVHVMPPISVLEGMATLRLHLDDCGDDNAPLRVALGSHRLGFVAADQAESVATQRHAHICHAGAGDVWAYSTPILHASSKSEGVRRRRVLQIDYATEPLAGGLEWLGVSQREES